MKSPSEKGKDWGKIRDELAGLGSSSGSKNYHAELKKRIEELEIEIERRKAAEEELKNQAYTLEAEIAARQKAEELLEVERNNARSVFESSPIPMLLINPQCRIIDVNRSMESLSRYCASEMIGKVPGQVIDCGFVDEKSLMCGQANECLSCRLKELVRGVASSGIARHNVELVNKKLVNGELSDQFLKISLEPINIDRQRCTIVSVDDVTQRRLQECEVAAERERLAVTLRSIGDGVIATDAECRVTFINSASENATGWSNQEAAGAPCREVFKVKELHSGKDISAIVEEVLESRTKKELANNTMLTRKDGSEIPVADSVSPIFDDAGKILGTVIVFRDMTEKYEMQDELLRRRKLDALGVLAGGIAHDFNNLLTGIIGNVSIALMRCEENPKLTEPLERALAASENATSLTRQLLTFSKGGAPVKELLKISKLLTDSARFVLRGSKTALKVNIPDDLWSCEADPGQLSQVISNLVINADQAMPDGGTVSIVCSNQVLNEQYLGLSAANYVVVEVKDDGIGISPENLLKIFDPYFTTKRHGNGLGLATVYSIMERHGGKITVASQVGEGTHFTLYLKASVKNGCVEEKETVTLNSGKGKVMIMDDDAIIRDLASDMLKMLGYEPLAVTTGEEAVDAYSDAFKNRDPFLFVIFDLTIPGAMGGAKAMDAILEIDPDAVGIVASGYCNDAVLSSYQNHGFVASLPKPFNIHQFSKVIAKCHEVLRGRA